MQSLDSYQPIYADNAATTALAPEALEQMLPFLQQQYANASSSYSLGRSVRKALAQARADIAACIGAQDEEIYFTGGGTESDNWAIHCILTAALARQQRQYRKIAISAIEHHAIINSCQQAQKLHNFTIRTLPTDKTGIIKPAVLARSIAHDSHNAGESELAGISIMLANNEVGTVQNIKSLCALAHTRHIPFHTDAVQAVGHLSLNVHELDVDLLSASAHKFNGPKGIGFLYAKKEAKTIILTPLLAGGQQEASMRAGTENIAGIVGMAAALKLNTAKLAEHTSHLQSLSRMLQALILQQLPEAIFNGHPTQRLPGHLSLTVPGISGEALQQVLDLKHIYVSTGAACNSRTIEPSHVLLALKMEKRLAQGTIRISLGAQNTPEQVQIIAHQICTYCRKVLALKAK